MSEALPGLTGYVLAGGRSSRMGQDKAAMQIGGRTLLEIAVAKFRGVCEQVVVIGGAVDGGADRVVADLHPGCGPMGGMEAALRELRGRWAMFLPVDMPLLPAGLVETLGSVWSAEALGGARVCMAVADEISQPLVSLVHRDALPTIEAAVTQARYKLQPVLAEAALAVANADMVPPGKALCRTEIKVLSGEPAAGATVLVGQQTSWQPSAAEWQFRHLWFSNLNTPEEFAGAEQRAGIGVMF